MTSSRGFAHVAHKMDGSLPLAQGLRGLLVLGNELWDGRSSGADSTANGS